MGKFDKYKACSDVLGCPVCGQPLWLFEESGRVLKCDLNHSFDIARQGYINLYRGKPLNEYSKESFAERQVILEKDMYAHILGEICAFLERVPGAKILLDAGCGEGYYSREIAAKFGDAMQIYGADLSRDSVQLAAATGNKMGGAAGDIKWLVADIGKLPVQDSSVDLVLDIFTSANYQEFKRILKDDGFLIKVIPGENHVCQLRYAAKSQLFHKEYKQRRGADVFAQEFEVVERKVITKTFSVNEEERDIFIRMTPLLFAVDKAKIDWSVVKEITVEGELLIGRKKMEV